MLDFQPGLVQIGKQGEGFLDHPPGEHGDICFIAIVGRLQVSFLDLDQKAAVPTSVNCSRRIASPSPAYNAARG